MDKVCANQKGYIFKLSIVYFEKCNIELKIMGNKCFSLLYEPNIEEKYRKVNNFFEDGILNDISYLLKNLNAKRKEEKDRNGNWPILSANDLLMTKFICEIINDIFDQIPSAIDDIIKVEISQELITFLQYVPIHIISISHS